jgi:hypothetical protein
LKFLRRREALWAKCIGPWARGFVGLARAVGVLPAIYGPELYFSKSSSSFRPSSPITYPSIGSSVTIPLHEGREYSVWRLGGAAALPCPIGRPASALGPCPSERKVNPFGCAHSFIL